MSSTEHDHAGGPHSSSSGWHSTPTGNRKRSREDGPHANLPQLFPLVPFVEGLHPLRGADQCAAGVPAAV